MLPVYWEQKYPFESHPRTHNSQNLRCVTCKTPYDHVEVLVEGKWKVITNEEEFKDYCVCCGLAVGTQKTLLIVKCKHLVHFDCRTKAIKETLSREVLCSACKHGDMNCGVKGIDGDDIVCELEPSFVGVIKSSFGSEDDDLTDLQNQCPDSVMNALIEAVLGIGNPADV